jgi:hypothetical protein
MKPPPAKIALTWSRGNLLAQRLVHHVQGRVGRRRSRVTRPALPSLGREAGRVVGDKRFGDAHRAG